MYYLFHRKCIIFHSVATTHNKTSTKTLSNNGNVCTHEIVRFSTSNTIGKFKFYTYARTLFYCCFDKDARKTMTVHMKSVFFNSFFILFFILVPLLLLFIIYRPTGLHVHHLLANTRKPNAPERNGSIDRVSHFVVCKVNYHNNIHILPITLNSCTYFHTNIIHTRTRTHTHTHCMSFV